MKKLGNIIGFGLLTWLVPFVAGFFCYSQDGQPLFDIYLVKTTMLLVSSIFGAFMLVAYFRKVDTAYLKESVCNPQFPHADDWSLLSRSLAATSTGTESLLKDCVDATF